MLIVFAMIGCFVLGALVFSSRASSWGGYDRARRAYVVFCSVLLGLQSGLRDLSVGPDTMQYLNRFETVKAKPWDAILQSMWNYFFQGNTGEYKDPTYDLVEKVFQITGLDYRAWLLLVAAVFFTAFGMFLYRNTRRISDVCFALILYMIIYYSFYSVTGIRQTLAMALCLWAFEAAKNRKFPVFLILVLAAFSIHKSALLFLPAYLLIDFKHPKSLLGAALVLLPFLFVFRSSVVTMFGTLMGYEDYTTTYATAGAYGYCACALVAAVLVWFEVVDIVAEDGRMRSYISLFAVSVVVIPALWVNPSIMRVVQYYSIFILLVFPAVLRSFEPRRSMLMSRHGSADSSMKAALRATEVGHLYLLCILFLIAYCCSRFYGYQYSFFFMDMVF